ncbi:MAG: hypothetical protein HWQ41_26125 [Nostoc sp. NOS(2021)]|nr:hypothetical protein [Nostoc sp. NOS(2021)]
MTPNRMQLEGYSRMARIEPSNRFGELVEILLLRYQRQDEVESYGQTANWKVLNIQA